MSRDDNHLSPQYREALTRWGLDTLLESSLSLGATDTPEQAMDTFLLTAMGWSGASRAFLVVADPLNNACRVISRGLTASEMATLRTGSASIARDGLELTLGCPTPGHGKLLLVRNPPSGDSSWPADMELAVAFTTDGCGPGMIGLGPRVSGHSYADGDSDLLMAITGHFVSTMDRIRASRVIRDLNRDLNRRNERLSTALEETGAMRTDLNRQIFHLNAIGGAIKDLSAHLRDEHRSVDTFLLTLCGVFGLDRADLLLMEQGQDEPRLWTRGGSLPNLQHPTAQDMLYACLDSLSFQALTPLSIHFVDSSALAAIQSVPDAYAKASSLALFRLDESVTGMLALSHDQESAIPVDTLLPLANTFLLFLRNARSFATISALNRNLAERNIALERTLNELSASQKRVEVLERAREQISTVLRRHTLEIGRPSWKDGIWIVLAGLLLGLIFNFTSPAGLSLIPKEWTRPDPALISAQQSAELLDQGAILVDARPAELHRLDPDPRSINLPASLFDFTYSMHLGEEPLDTPIIVYGRTISSRYDEDVAYRLAAQGHEQVFVAPNPVE